MPSRSTQKQPTKSGTTRSTTRTSAKASKVFSAEERAAMQEAARERKSGSQNGEQDLLDKIAAMQEPDRVIAERLHALVTQTAPDLAPRTWYGMPAYANRDGKVVCHFQSAQKFKTRYATLGFSERAHLDSGAMWPVSFAVAELTDDVEKQIVKLVKRAVS